MSFVFIVLLVFVVVLILIGYARYYYLTRLVLNEKEAAANRKLANDVPEEEDESRSGSHLGVAIGGLDRLSGSRLFQFFPWRSMRKMVTFIGPSLN